MASLAGVMADDEDSQVKTVSSLRSRFEQMISPSSTPTLPSTDGDVSKGKQSATVPARQLQPQQQHHGIGGNHARDQEVQYPFGESSRRRPEGRGSLDIPRERSHERPAHESTGRDTVHNSGSRMNNWEQDSQSSAPHLVPPAPATRPAPRQRPQSMVTPRITPAFKVDSPSSPAPLITTHHTGIAKSKTPPPVPPFRTSRPTSPTRESSFKNPPPIPTSTRPSRPITLSVNSRPSGNTELVSEPNIHAPTVRSAPVSPAMPMLQEYCMEQNTSRTPELPSVPPPVPTRPEKYRTSGKKQPPVPVKKTDSLGVAPASDEKVSPFSTPPSSPEKSHGSADDLSQFFAKRNAAKRASIATSTVMTAKPPPPPPPLPPKAVRPPIATPSGLSRFEASRAGPSTPIVTRASIDSSELRPTLPPRPKGGLFSLHVRKNSLRGRSASPPRATITPTPVAFENTPHVGFMPPPQRSHNVKISSPSLQQNRHKVSPAIEPLNTAYDLNTPEVAYADDSDEPEQDQDRLSEYPDVSQANRRRPLFRNGPHEIHCKTDVRLFAVSGQYVCTVSGSTRVWNVSTGECIMSLSHGETTRITAVAFKPSVDVLDEGTVLWLGTSNGELLEVDIATQRVIESRASAHTKKEVVRIHRCGYELWTLDEGGKLQVWAPGPDGIPNLRNSPTTFRINNKHTYSLVVGSQLWIGAGKSVHVYSPTQDGRSDVLSRPLAPSKATGDITCGTLVNSEPDKVYFGHSDGKVSIYSRSTLQCVDVVSVSLYKINSMCGVGDYLWTGFKTGMVYVYDVRTKPWRAIKDWQAHDTPVAEVIGDRTSIWKVDRLQVISLGTDNIIKVWDGMLEEDWLEAKMVKHDSEFCNFREIKALVCTWNAGASKPQDLLTRTDDAAFLENVLSSIDSPEIIVFGFQELVDLEDKKLTAKSLLKGGKKKRAQATQERMSHQYRLWQKQLTKSIETYMPRDQPYMLLHSANLVGLFTCIFIKQSERTNIRNLAASTVKRGLGGLHGNKGGLIIRFLLDDSSLCFINCHLAAGQSHTISRNNDIAAILESNNLPIETDRSARSDMFVGGGDGSMILDHEICILNGDLNYRIDGHRDSIIHKVQHNQIDALLERDQLLVERKRNPGFRLRVFHEMPIRFAPTYKYDVGTDTYDTSEKKRSPAWCDRLLFRGIGRIKQLEYRRHEVHASDHRPLSGTFLIKLKTVSQVRKVQVWERCVEEYRQVKREMIYEAKVDFLISVCGYQREEAARLLSQKSLPAAVKALQ